MTGKENKHLKTDYKSVGSTDSNYKSQSAVNIIVCCCLSNILIINRQKGLI